MVTLCYLVLNGNILLEVIKSANLHHNSLIPFLELLNNYRSSQSCDMVRTINYNVYWTRLNQLHVELFIL